MRLEVIDVAELRLLADRGDVLPLELPEPTLDAAIELACEAQRWAARADRAALAAFRGWASSCRQVQEALEALEGRRRYRPEYDAVSSDIRSVTADTSFAHFQNRFRASLQTLGGFSKEVSHALGGALWEMIDNVLQHSKQTAGTLPSSVMAFDVREQEFSFVVADVGRGVVASLHENESWRGVTDYSEALRVIVEDHASRRPSGDPGLGFKRTIDALADVGRLRVRSGDAYVSVEGSHASRVAAIGTRPMLAGVQVSVTFVCT